MADTTFVRIKKDNLNLPNRIYGQYANSPKLKKWINITRELATDVVDGAEEVRKCLDLNTASGKQLEMIGKIVVVERIKKEQLMNAAEFAFPDGDQFGDDIKKTFAEWSTFTNEDLNDEMLRLAIRAKIIKNTANPTMEGLLIAFNTLFPDGKVFRIINHHDMSFSVEYIGILTPLQQWLININDFIPTPQGVELREFIRSYGIIEFLDENKGEVDDQFGDESLEFIK